MREFHCSFLPITSDKAIQHRLLHPLKTLVKVMGPSGFLFHHTICAASNSVLSGPFTKEKEYKICSMPTEQENFLWVIGTPPSLRHLLILGLAVLLLPRKRRIDG